MRAKVEIRADVVRITGVIGWWVEFTETGTVQEGCQIIKILHV